MYLIDSNDTATPIGTLMSNTHLHPNDAVIIPPKTIPAAKPEPEAAAKTPRARFLSLPSGKAATRIDSPVAEYSSAKSLKHSCNDQNNFRWRNASCQPREIPQGPVPRMVLAPPSFTSSSTGFCDLLSI